MHCTCVRQTDLPQVSSFFADVLYHPDRTAGFYRHPMRDLASFQAAAAEIRFTDEQRAGLVSALLQENPRGASLELLARPDAVAVVTGQQVGLFSGPAYTIYKALHAARLARWLTANGVPAAPVFWLATEDHDFAEVNHAWVYDAEHRPVKLEMRRAASAQPVGEIVLETPPVEELHASLTGLPYGEAVADLARAAYRPGNTMGRAFGELLRRLLQKLDILQVDPMLPAFRQLAAPAIRAAVEAGPGLTAALLERNRQLVAAGYHAQVHVEDSTSLVFLLEDGKRLGLRRHGSDYLHNGRRFSSAELADQAATLSPNAVLRPVVQDSFLPTVAYIGGPAETAYLAQSEVIYRSILGRMPVAVPRSGFTILDERSQRRMTRYGLELPDFFHGEDALREHIARTLVPPALAGTVRQAAAAVDETVEKLRREMAEFDPTLAKALDRCARKMRYQIGKIEGKAGREALRRDQRAARDAVSLYSLVYPEHHLQERVYSILPFLAEHGLDLIDRIHEAIQLDCVDHRLMVV